MGAKDGVRDYVALKESSGRFGVIEEERLKSKQYKRVYERIQAELRMTREECRQRKMRLFKAIR